jgi:hypothetical protein
MEFFGRKSGSLARQLMLLRPGRYQIGLSAEGSASGSGSQILMQVTCHGSDTELVKLPLQGLTSAPRRLSAQFTVPAGGCAGQWLVFAANAAEFPEVQSARISDLSLLPAGAAR